MNWERGNLSLLKEVLIFRFADFINRSDFYSYLQKWRNISSLPENEIEEMSQKNLHSILNFARSKIPYYINQGIDYSDDPNVLLSRFPIMKKKDIAENRDLLISKKQDKLIKYYSSGSSGVQGSVLMSKEEQSVIRAIMYLWWEWSGYFAGKLTIQTGITDQRGLLKSIKDFLLGITYVPAFSISEESALKIFKKFGSKKNLHLAGFPSSLNVLAEFALKNSVTDVKFDSAICWGDKLFEKYTRNIETAFGCRPKEVYSCNEGFLVAAKKDLEYFYIMSPHVFIEIVDGKGNAVKDGEMGYVLLTRLDCFSMPLIRYYVGDLAIKLPREKYPKEREMGFPLLERVIGRDTDVVLTKSGRTLIVHFFTGIFEFVPEIIQFRVVQHQIGEIEIEYIPGEGFHHKILTELEETIHTKCEDILKINWKGVKDIPSTSSGKPQIIQSFIAK